MGDIRDELFREIASKRFRAVLTAERAGVLAGTDAARQRAQELGIALEVCKRDGADIGHGERVGHLLATPKQMAQAEECLMGALGKASGIATAARTAVQLADGRARIVSGSWKKMPLEIKDMVREAIAVGGASYRIAQPPMIYLDKNYIRMLGSVERALAACRPFGDITKVIQIRGENAPVEEETLAAVESGADILMVDTGVRDDLLGCIRQLERARARGRVQVAFAGNVTLTDVPELSELADILCLGKALVDAPLLDWKLDVIGEE